MRDRLSVFDLCLPGIVAGMILAGVVLGVGDALFPDAFQKVFPRETFLLLAVATNWLSNTLDGRLHPSQANAAPIGPTPASRPPRTPRRSLRRSRSARQKTGSML